jgi:hypothetical protein
MQPMGRLIRHSNCLDLGRKGGGIFFIFLLFSTCSLQVPNGFSKLFPIAPRFNPIRFARSLPLLTSTGGPKGEALHLSLESSILGSLHSFNIIFQWANQIGSLPPQKKKKKKKVELVRHPQLINLKQNKYPQFIFVSNNHTTVVSASHFGNVFHPWGLTHPWALPMVKHHQVKLIISLSIGRSQGVLSL